MDFDHLAKKLDAKYNFPRPANEQHLSERRALVRLIEGFTKGASYVASALVSSYLLYCAASFLKVELFTAYGGFFAFAVFLVVLVAFVDIFQLKTPYLKVTQRETFGANRWATESHLKQKQLITPNDRSPLPEAVPLAAYGHKHLFTLPIKMFLRHVLVLGPSGSGKTASFFINTIRAWSQVGGAVILDISKNHGEVSRFSAHYYQDVYRFDLVNPECSDRFSLRDCKRNPSLAYDVASFMIGYDSNNMTHSGGSNPVWPQSAVALLKCLLLHLNEILDDPTPADIFKFVHDHPYDKDEKVDHLEVALLTSPYHEVRESYAVFKRGAGGDPRVASSVFFSMSTPLEPFRDPTIRKIMSMPTDEERARGCRVIDFKALRRKGSALYVVVKEGTASRYEAVLGTFYGLAIEVLKQNADEPGACPVVFFNDENANIPFRNMGETLTTARGRRMGFMCGYQDISQIEKQFGNAPAKSLRQNVATRLFLPGLTDETADFAVKMLGKTTTFQSSSNDAVGRALDSERLSEVGVDLWDATKFRQMLPFTQAIVVCETADPARVAFPPMAEVVDPRESYPARYDMSFSVTQEAAELYRLALMTPVERIIDGARPALLGEELALLHPPQTVTQQPPHNVLTVFPGEYNPQLNPAGTYDPFHAIPFAPYQPPKQRQAGGEDEEGEGDADGAHAEMTERDVRFSDESRIPDDPPAAPRARAALSEMMRRQATVAPPASHVVDEDEAAALLAAVTPEADTSVGDDFTV